MMNFKDRFLVEDTRPESYKHWRISKEMVINAGGLAVAVLIAVFDVPEATAAAAVMGFWNILNMVLRWYSRGGEVKAKVKP